MIEYPESVVISRQLKENVTGKKVSRVFSPSKQHKFCWFNGNPDDYEAGIIDSVVSDAVCFGLFVEIRFDNGKCLCINDGVNVRFIDSEQIPKSYQLVIIFNDGTALVFTVAMYGGIVLHDGNYENEYYQKSLSAVNPLSAEFKAHFEETVKKSEGKLSVKAFLATQQRFPGIGNGTLQDILFAAGLNPKRKIATLDSGDWDRMYSSTVAVLREMTERGGRDTERNIFGKPGGYITKLSKLTLSKGCPVCSGEIIKETYLGGSVYYCPVCQPSVADTANRKKI